MYLAKNSLVSIVRTQFNYKLQGNLRFFSAVVVTHLITILLGILGMNGSSAMSDGHISVQIIRTYSDLIVFASIACSIGAAINLNTRESVDMDFNFTANRLTSNLTNGLVMIVFSIYAAFCTAFGSLLMRVGKYLYIGSHNLAEGNFFIAPIEVASSLFVSFMYIILFGAAAYFCAALVRRNGWYSALIFAFMAFAIRSGIHKDVFNYFYNETNLYTFLIKCLTSAVLLFASAVAVTNDLEVRR